MAYDLVGIGGLVEGERFVLETEGETLIGRTQRGINLPDPMVSVQHAKLVFAKGTWTLTDLESATGTKVNGTPVQPSTPVELAVGDVVEIGECLLRVDSSGNRVIRRLLWAMVPAWALVALALMILYWASGPRDVSLSMNEPVRTTRAATTNLVIPKTFIREHAVDVSALALRRVTDFDRNEVDELWLYSGDRELAITFTDTGWKLLGKLPKGCVDREGDDFPDLDCAGTHYRLMESQYTPVAQADPVIWLTGEPAGQYEIEEERGRKRKGKAKAKAKQKGAASPAGNVRTIEELAGVAGAAGPVPFRMSMGRVDRLAGFLASRGVTEPVHYVICEDVFTGMPAQALTRGGEVQHLSYGCADGILFEGDRSPAFEGARVAALAVTAGGHEMLTRHLSYSWSGAAEPLLVPGPDRAVLRVMERDPKPIRGGVYIGFDETGHIFNPVAVEALTDERIQLEYDGERGKDAMTFTLLSRGKARLDPEGCAELVVRTRPFRCALMRGCLPGATFVTVTEQGCGEDRVVLAAGYGAGATVGETEHIKVRLEVQADAGLGVTDIIQARMAVQPL